MISNVSLYFVHSYMVIHSNRKSTERSQPYTPSPSPINTSHAIYIGHYPHNRGVGRRRSLLGDNTSRGLAEEVLAQLYENRQHNFPSVIFR